MQTIVRLGGGFGDTAPAIIHSSDIKSELFPSSKTGTAKRGSIRGIRAELTHHQVPALAAWTVAKKEIIVARLPELVADRTDPLKLETAIRYVGGIIFDASQDPGGEVAGWLAEILSSPGSLEETQAREAILILLRDGFLERYADYPAWIHIARAAGITLEEETAHAGEASAGVDTPISTVNSQTRSVPDSSVEAAEQETDSPLPPEADKAIDRTSSQNEPTRILNSASKIPSGIAGTPDVAEESDRISPDSGSTGQPIFAHAIDPFEICSVDNASQDPFELTESIKAKSARDLAEADFPYLISFVPRLVRSGKCVEWKNPLGGEVFRDYGDRLTCESPSAAALRAMLDLAQAKHWTRVEIKGGLPTEALIGPTPKPQLTLAAPGLRQKPIAEQADQRSTTIPRYDTDLGNRGSPANFLPPKRRPRIAVRATFVLVCIAVGLSAIYVRSVPGAWTELRTGHFSNALPWRIYTLLSARAHPLKLASLSLAVCAPDGSRLGSSGPDFRDVELNETGHMKWSAIFDNQLAGFEDHKEIVSARFFDPNGSLIAESSDEQPINSNQRTATFSAITSGITGHPAGRYRIELSSGDKPLGQQEFYVREDIPVTRETVRTEPTPGVVQTPIPSEGDAELAFWHSIETSRNPREYQAYLKQYPFGRFAELATTRIVEYTPAKPPSLLPAPPSGYRISEPTFNPTLSASLRDYLRHNRLPFVNASVRADRMGTATSVELRGRVATEHGKQDAELKSRDYLNAPNVSINNDIVVDPTLARSTTGVQSHYTGPPSAECIAKCARTYAACSTGCTSQMTAEMSAVQAGGYIPPIIAQSIQNSTAVVAGSAGAGAVVTGSGLIQSHYQACSVSCGAQQSTCVDLCR